MQIYGTAEKNKIRSVVPEPVKNCWRIKKLIATKTSKRIEMIINVGVLMLFIKLWMRKFLNVLVSSCIIFNNPQLWIASPSARNDVAVCHCEERSDVAIHIIPKLLVSVL